MRLASELPGNIMPLLREKERGWRGKGCLIIVPGEIPLEKGLNIRKFKNKSKFYTVNL